MSLLSHTKYRAKNRNSFGNTPTQKIINFKLLNIFVLLLFILYPGANKPASHVPPSFIQVVFYWALSSCIQNKNIQFDAPMGANQIHKNTKKIEPNRLNPLKRVLNEKFKLSIQYERVLWKLKCFFSFARLTSPRGNDPDTLTSWQDMLDWGHTSFLTSKTAHMCPQHQLYLCNHFQEF